MKFLLRLIIGAASGGSGTPPVTEVVTHLGVPVTNGGITVTHTS